MDAEGALEGMLQRAWDRVLETKPVLLILIGSDLSMMEAPEQLWTPVPPARTGDGAGSATRRRWARWWASTASAFDAALITGGLPLICAEWTHGAGMWEFLKAALSDPVSASLVSAERSLAAEFPQQAQARTVLSAIGDRQR